jgi:hypothetical protein
MNNLNELGWIENKEFMQTMGICKRTAQTWRDKNIVPFTQIGGKIYYKVSDIQELLNGNIKIKIEVKTIK